PAHPSPAQIAQHRSGPSATVIVSLVIGSSPQALLSRALQRIILKTPPSAPVAGTNSAHRADPINVMAIVSLVIAH
ncbi:MAG: hypothetical protein K8963_10170, partial [Proteobacteria bacterium]|nr:hypothetical protein [Pseudomonadota bacterium]